jgi:hypothetical protein
LRYSKHDPLSAEKPGVATVVRGVEFVGRSIRRVSLLATSTGKHLPLLRDTVATVTEFDGCACRSIDAGRSSRGDRPAVGTGAEVISPGAVAPLKVARPAADKTYRDVAGKMAVFAYRVVNNPIVYLVIRL